MTFEAGAVKTARAHLSNPTSRSFTYTVELFLGVDRAATSGQGMVTIGPGQTKEVTFTLTMPSVEGVHEVYLGVWADSELVTLYRAESVTIQVAPAIEIIDIIWE